MIMIVMFGDNYVQQIAVVDEQIAVVDEEENNVVEVINSHYWIQ